jgi:hypothetical protein
MITYAGLAIVSPDKDPAVALVFKPIMPAG